MLLYSAAVIYEAVECVRPRSLSLSLAASEANYGHQCFVALDLDFSQVSANFTAFAKVCRLLYILPCLLLLLLYSLLLMRNSFPSQYTVQCSQALSNKFVEYVHNSNLLFLSIYLYLFCLLLKYFTTEPIEIEGKYVFLFRT